MTLTKKKILPILSLCLFLFTATSLKAQNPIIQTTFTADPAPMVYHDTVFLYTSHDVTTSYDFNMQDWRLFSTIDMVNWTDRGAPLSLKTFSWANKEAWAGQCIFRNGKFYWYVPMNRTDGKGMAIGVAVGPTAEGPFIDAIGHPLAYTGRGDIDPTVFIDTDGQAYLYWGNPHLFYVKLNQDMISYSGDIQMVPFTEQGFGKRTGDPNRFIQYEEGPWFYKRNNLYYMVYAAGGVPEHIAFSTSMGPTGPWVYRDTIMRSIKKHGAFTNHPGMIDYHGKSYFFYHNEALPGGGGFTRSVCVDQFTYQSDGTISMITPTTEGVTEAVRNLDPFVRQEAETIAWESGVSTATGNNGIYVTNVDSGDYIKVRSVDFKRDPKSFYANVAANTDGGMIEIHIDSPTGFLLGTLSVKSTGGLEIWGTQSVAVNKARGIHDVYFVFKGSQGHLFNFNWWKFN